MIIEMKALDLIQCCRPLDPDASAAVFKALGDPARVTIVKLLEASDGPICACEFVPALGLTQATVSHHLKKLTDAGLLEREQRGKWAYFSLAREAVAA